MRELLIISPRFPPTNAPDFHRIRVSIGLYRKFGWNPTVLCLAPEGAGDVHDDALARALPADIKIVRVNGWSEKVCRYFGFGHLDYRCLFPLYRAGFALLKAHSYDVIFFSTTSFLVFLLAPIWKARFGCKIVFDYQDPWFQGDISPYEGRNVPGTWWKYRLGQVIARHGERFAMSHADHIISVSQGYVDSLSERYRWLKRSQFTVLPFAAAEEDFELVKRYGIRHSIFERDGLIRWIYAGRGGPDMEPVLTALFENLSVFAKTEPAYAAKLRLHFVGTNYAPADRSINVVQPLAVAYGVGEMVEEHSNRIPYLESISLYSESDGILLIGSKSPDYTASKLLNCILSRKPILALFHKNSMVSEISGRFPNVYRALFDRDPAEPGFRSAVASGLRWLGSASFEVADIDREIAPWSVEEATRKQCLIFDRLCNP